MSESRLRVAAALAAEVCKGFHLSQAGRVLLQPQHTPAQFVQALVGKRRYPEALEFFAHALPKREAVWWACLCVEAVSGPDLPSAERLAVDAAVQWVLNPSDRNRRAAYAPGQLATLVTPGGAVATAVYWSGGSVLPPDSALTAPPAPTMCAQAAARAVLSAAGCRGNCTHNYRQYVALANAVAIGQHLWDLAA